MSDSWSYSEETIAAHEAYEEALASDLKASPTPWLDLASPHAAAMVSSLLQSGAAVVGFDQAWLFGRMEELPPSLVIDLLPLLQSMYRDQVGLGSRPRWNDYTIWNRSPEELDLRLPGDPFPLGFLVDDQWRLEERIAGGGFGVVYRGVGSRDSSSVAVKAPRRLLGNQAQEAINQLLHEHEVLAQLSVPGVPLVRSLLDVEGAPVLVMEFIEGMNLESLGRLSPTEALLILSKAARILDGVHRAGFQCGDLKPGNVLIGGEGKVHLIDFGLAQPIAPWLAVPRRVAGSLPFMSPAQMGGEPEDRGVHQDIWAMGSMLYQLVAGMPLHEETTLREAFNQSVKIGGIEPPEWPDETPKSIHAIFQFAVNRFASDRFATAGDFADACEQALAEPEGEIEPRPRLEFHAFRFGVDTARMWTDQHALLWAFTQAAEENELGEIQLENWPKIMAGIAILHDELVARAKHLDLAMPESHFEDRYREAFRQKGHLSPEAMKALAGSVKEAGQWCAKALRSIRGQLDDMSPNKLLTLFDVGILGRTTVWNDASKRQWPARIEESRLPFSVYSELLDGLRQSEPPLPTKPLQLLVQVWEYRMTRFLLWEDDHSPASL